MIGSRIGRVMRGKPKMLGTTSQILHNNWKLYVENVKDTYHASLLHTFLHDLPHQPADHRGGVADRPNPAATTPATPRGKDRRRAADQLYAGIHSLRRGLPARGIPRLLDSVDEIGDGITLQILSVFPNFVLQQIQQLDRAAACSAEGAGRDRIAVDLYRLRGRRRRR